MAVEPDLQFRRAIAADFDAVYAIYAEAATWLKSREISQWAWFLTDHGKQIVRRRIESAETYLVFDRADTPVATIAIQWQDEQIWGLRGRDGSAGYVHGLAICRSAAGRGLGLKLLAWASERIARNSRHVLRLDCMAMNEALCDYYRRAGFTDLGIASTDIGNWSVRLFERPVSP